MSESYNPIEDVEDENISFVHPNYLPNTSFIKTKPKPIKLYVIDNIEKFMEFHKLSKYSIDKDFIMWKNGLDNWKKENYSPKIETCQRILDDMYYYDLLSSEEKKDRLYKRNRPYNIKENLLKKINLFRSRHFLSERQFSEYFFGSYSLLLYFRIGKLNFYTKTLDKAFLKMHMADKELIEEMGEIYVEWERTNKK